MKTRPLGKLMWRSKLGSPPEYIQEFQKKINAGRSRYFVENGGLIFKDTSIGARLVNGK